MNTPEPNSNELYEAKKATIEALEHATLGWKRAEVMEAQWHQAEAELNKARERANVAEARVRLLKLAIEDAELWHNGDRWRFSSDPAEKAVWERQRAHLRELIQSAAEATADNQFMRIITPGYKYELEQFDNPSAPGQTLQFIEKVKRDTDADLVLVNDGTTNEEVLKMLIDRLGRLQAKFYCRENAIVITKLEESLMWLNKRTEDRKARNVEGKQVP